MSDNTDHVSTAVVTDDLITAWTHHLAAADRSRHTVRAYRHTLNHFLAWYASEARQSLTLADLTPIALVGYRNFLQHDQGKATSTINTHVAALRAWCAWLHDEQQVAVNPAAHLKFVGRQTPGEPTGLTDRQINALLRATQHTADPPRNYAIVQLLLQTGMRIGECTMLNYGDIALHERSGSVRIRAGKGNKMRLIPLNGSARAALATYVAPIFQVAPTIEAVVSVWSTPQALPPLTPLWRSRRSARLSVQAIRRMMDDLVNACARHRLVPPTASAHTLRHTFAMRYLVDNPGDIIGLATLLGHQSLETTRIYGQPTSEQLARRVEGLALNAYSL